MFLSHYLIFGFQCPPPHTLLTKILHPPLNAGYRSFPVCGKRRDILLYINTIKVKVTPGTNENNGDFGTEARTGISFYTYNMSWRSIIMCT